MTEYYDFNASTPERLIAKAAETGRSVVTPNHDQLFIDLDSEEALDTFRSQMEIFQRSEHMIWQVHPSKTPGHYHAKVTLRRFVVGFERVALQAALGSDRKRELLAILQAKDGMPGPNVFFE